MRKKWRKFLFLEMKWCLVSPIRASITSLKVNLAKSGSLFSMYTVQGITKIFLHTMTTILWRTTNLENLLVFIMIWRSGLVIVQLLSANSNLNDPNNCEENYIDWIMIWRSYSTAEAVSTVPSMLNLIRCRFTIPDELMIWW